MIYLLTFCCERHKQKKIMDKQKRDGFFDWLEMEIMLLETEEEYEKKEKLKKETITLKKSEKY